MNPVVLTLAGVALLFLGGEWLLRGAVALAARIGISPLLVGMTIVAAGTSAPELVVSVSASASGNPGLALGNVVGSNICNLLLILGLAALLHPIVIDPCSVRRDLKVLAASAVALTALVLLGEIGRIAGAALLSAQVVYVVFSYRAERSRPSACGERVSKAPEEVQSERPAWLSTLFVVVGAACLVLGSRFLVDGASEIARSLGVSDAVIGLTLVALGTSLPELATSSVAALRGHSDIAVGNVVGSNIFNSLAILGAAGLAAPLAVPASFVSFDIWVMLGASVLGVLVLWRGSFGRVPGAIALVGYAAFIAATWV